MCIYVLIFFCWFVCVGDKSTMSLLGSEGPRVSGKKKVLEAIAGKGDEAITSSMADLEVNYFLFLFLNAKQLRSFF